METISADTLLADIDVQTPFYDQKAASGVKVEVPGDVAGQTMSPAQVRFLINGMHAVANNDNGYLQMPIVEVVAAERKRCNLSARQANFTMLERYTQEANAPLVNEPMTDSQHRTVSDLIGALTGGEAHWDTVTNERCSKLPEALRNALVMKLFNAETRGQYAIALAKATSLVGNPAARKRTADTEDDEINNLAAEAEAEEAFA